MPAPFLIFCSDPLNPRSAEPAFAAEVVAAQAAGFTVSLLDHDALDHGIDADAALRKTRFDAEGGAVYRGWMLTSPAYASLFAALADRGVTLLTTPEAYTACHHAPGSYPALSQWMPKTAWLPLSEAEDAEAVRTALRQFGSSAIIIKDWVKSQAAGYWNEACYIADASATAAAARVIARFRELQGESLVGGLVFKAYVPLLPLGQPAHEVRAFVVNGKPVGCWPRSEQAGFLPPPPDALLQQVAAQIPSPFASADFALDADGKWWLLEVGDGQVSGLPDPEAAGVVFPALAECAGAKPRDQ